MRNCKASLALFLAAQEGYRGLREWRSAKDGLRSFQTQSCGVSHRFRRLVAPANTDCGKDPWVGRNLADTPSQ